MVSWLLFGVLSVRPGASSASPNGVRATGISVNCSARGVSAPPAELPGAGRAPFTTTTSLTGATLRTWSIVTVPPSGTAAVRCTVDIPFNANLTTYVPGGRPGTLYTPLMSVTAVRSPWSESDDTVTVTPGKPRLSDDDSRP